MTVVELRKALENYAPGATVEIVGCVGWELTTWKDHESGKVVLGALEPMEERESNP